MKKIDVLRKYGSGANIARALGISRQAVSGWGEVIPEIHALRLSNLDDELEYDETLYRKPTE